MKEKAVCFTGHRSIKEDPALLEERLVFILEKLIQDGYDTFYVGGARGFDALASRVVLHLKEKYSAIRLILILPFVNQYEKESGWMAEEIEEYQFFKKAAEEVIHLREGYRRGCYYQRNEYLVDHTSLCICYQYKKSGGTAYTVQYAEKKNIKVINCYEKNKQ